MIRKPVIGAGMAVLVMAIPILGAPGPASQQQEIESHIRQAREYLRANRPDLAEREFSAILALDPSNADARGNLGVMLFFGGEYTKAVPQLRAALKVEPNLPKIQALLGMAEKRSGESASARADLEKAFPQLKEEKLRVETGMELIEVYYAAGDLEKAAGVVGVLRQLKPEDVNILYTAHRIYSDLADESMLTMAMLAPGSARMHQLMAHEMARQGNVSGAIANYREALKLNPKLPDLHFELAEMLNTLSDASSKEEAEKEYRAALAENPFDEKSECRLGAIALRRSDGKGALARYSRALELQPNDAEANLGLAKTLIAMHETEKAEPYLERAARIEPFNAATRYHLAMLYQRLGRAGDAHRELAEFEKLKKMKHSLEDVYREMRLQPKGQEQPDPDVPK